VTLPQLLHLQNAENILKKARSDEGRLKPLLVDNDERVTEELFFATLGRRPLTR